MTRRAERQSFEKEVLKRLSIKLKGTRWKKNQNAVFCELDGYYVDVFVNVALNAEKTTVCFSAKPMSLDDLYWQITQLDDNKSQPLSFRSWGAFTCCALPLAEKTIEEEGVGSDSLASQVIEWADTQLETSLPKLRAKPFSSAVAEHPNQVERGAYAITYVTSLIDEGKLVAARQSAAAYADGSAQSVGQHRHFNKDFHEIAVDWIDSTSPNNL